MLAINAVLATLLAGAGTVLADGAGIIDAISAIQNATLALGSTVGSWDGGVLGALPIVAESASLLGAIRGGQAAAEQQPGELLTDVEGFSVGVATIELVADVNATLATLVAAKPKFDADLLSAVVLLNLELEKGASSDFSGALLAKLPADLVAVGQTLADEITASFDEAIGVYSGGIL